MIFASPRSDGFVERQPDGTTKPLKMGADGIAISADRSRLYYCPLASRKLYSVAVDTLMDRSTKATKAAVQTVWNQTQPDASTRISNVEWDADITEDRKNELIAWTFVAGADVENSGSVRFQSTDRGTEVKVVMQYNPPGGAIGDAVAKLFGESPKQQLGDDLRRFKMLMETGEIATTEGQPKGR